MQLRDVLLMLGVFGLLTVLLNLVSAQSKLDAQFTVSITEGDGPLTVAFDATASTASEGVDYLWWFGDGGRDVGKQVSYTYEKIGEFAAILVLSEGKEQVMATQIIKVNGEGPLHTRQLEFVINTDEVREGFELAGSNRVYMDSATTVPVRDFNAGGETIVSLLNENYFSIAHDMIIPGLKETIEFNSANTVRSSIVQWLQFKTLPQEQIVDIYQLLDQHSQFSEAVEMLNQGKGLSASVYGSGEQLDFIWKIGFEVAERYLIDQGIDPEIYFGEE